MPVVATSIASREPYVTGVEGLTYERLDGTLTFAVTPSSPHNTPICDLALAPLDVDGRVRFTADFCLLHQTGSAGEGKTTNPRVIVDVCNRGRKIAVKDLNLSASSAVQRASDPGDVSSQTTRGCL